MKVQQIIVTLVTKGEALDAIKDVTQWLANSELPGEVIDLEISNINSVDDE